MTAVAVAAGNAGLGGHTLDRSVGAAFARQVPSRFFSPDNRARIVAVAAALPGLATDFFGFECRLGGAPPESDFLICVERDHGEAAALADAMERAPPGPEPFWRQLGSFCRQWTDGCEPWHGLIHNLWLEFDLAGTLGVPAVPVPSVFIGTEALTADAAPAVVAELAGALGRLTGQPDRPARCAALRAAVGALPPGGKLFQIGIMLSRGDDRVRICARDIAADRLPGFLAALGHPDPGAGLADLLRRYAGVAAELRVGFDAGPSGIAPRVGIEVYCGSDAAGGTRWQALQDTLRDDGLIRPDEIEAIAGWWGVLHERLLGPVWPRWLAEHPLGRGRDRQGCVSRLMHHVKITWSEQLPPAAKVYLSARLHWMEDAVLSQRISGLRRLWTAGEQ
jgi:hypothetical protein